MESHELTIDTITLESESYTKPDGYEVTRYFARDGLDGDGLLIIYGQDERMAVYQ